MSENQQQEQDVEYDNSGEIRKLHREIDLKLPETVTVLDAPLNGKVYVIGTAHFSVKSQQEVKDLIKQVQPDFVMLELCASRANILSLDEETVLREAKDMSVAKIKQLIKSSSVVQGVLQALLVRLYAKITEELGLAPGGEFRAAYREAQNVPGCQVFLGDMPINISLKRGFNSLPWYRKIKLAIALLFTNHKLSKDDIEKLKNKDILDSLLEEFGANFPEFKRVLIDERDICLAHSLKSASKPIPNEFVRGGLSPTVVVGVVGLGHVPGIVRNWNKELDVSEILKTPPPTKIGRYIKIAFLTAGVAFMTYKYAYPQIIQKYMLK